MGRGLLRLLVLLVPMVSTAHATSPEMSWAGILGWVRESFPTVTQVSTVELARMLEDGREVILIDAREAEEYAVSRIEGAHRALTVEEALPFIRARREAVIVIYCSVGYRSSKLARDLNEAGFAGACNLEGSIFRWANEGRPVFRNGHPVSQVHPYDALWGALLHRELWSFGPDRRGKNQEGAE